jgi:chromate reductase
MIIVGLSGSLRKQSYNSALLRAAAEAAPAGTTVEIASIRGIPLYDGDVEAESGVPAAVQELKDRVAAADGLLLVSPEYNNSIPGVFKNAVDWMTRPAADIKRVFGNKPVALMGATPGKGATALAQQAWLPIFRTLGTRAWFGPRITVGSAAGVFDSGGTLTDDQLRQQLRKFMVGFAEFIGAK